MVINLILQSKLVSIALQTIVKSAIIINALHVMQVFICKTTFVLLVVCLTLTASAVRVANVLFAKQDFIQIKDVAVPVIGTAMHA
jgi:hypothetical protein